MSLEDELLEQRLERIREIEALGFRPYGQRFEFSHTIPAILAEYAAKTAEELASPVRVRIAGRVQTLRRMGKAGFAHLAQAGERLNRLETRGWIASFWGTSENNRKARYYRLTAVGRQQLETHTDNWDRLVRAVNRVLRPASE